MKKKRATKRKDSRPKCVVVRCTRPAKVWVPESPAQDAFAVDMYCQSHAKKEADKWARKVVLARDEYRCQKCGATEDGPWSIQWAHIITRSELSIRWNPLNSMALCSQDHMAFGYDPAGFHDFIDERWPGRYDLLRAIRRESIARGDKPDYAEIIASL